MADMMESQTFRFGWTAWTDMRFALGHRAQAPSLTPHAAMSRVLIVAGIVLLVAGLLVQAGLPLGRLPGDLVIRRGNSTFYFPIVTCLVVSVVLSLLFALVRR